MTALHLCDNTICARVTVDPDAAAGGFGVRHVVDGTQSQNLLDVGAKGRGDVSLSRFHRPPRGVR
ncbi:hypothetical protein O4220_23990 [Rhodococcus ruber]|uniref:Uncharacterized protein n=1 Tax=Rhodococcus ruber TaxID=1830 RepID=A0ABT4MKS2_9NOCA|nr:hypothetical protein [Rhodococcus ruber]MCZ4521592.1 hypothetical protein [Rhodococcus ruber]